MKKTFSKFGLILAAGVFLASCQNVPLWPEPAVTEIAAPQALAVNVADIHIHDRFTPTMAPPHIEHTLANPPYTAAYNLLSRAYRASGANDTLIIEIQQASVAAGKRPLEGARPYRLWEAQTETLYRGDLKVTLRLVQSVAPYDQIGQGEVNINRSLSVEDTVSMAERDLALNGMVENMMQDMQQGITAVLDEKFGLRAPQEF